MILLLTRTHVNIEGEPIKSEVKNDGNNGWDFSGDRPFYRSGRFMDVTKWCERNGQKVMNQIKSYLIVILALMPLLTGLTSSIKAQEPVTAQRLENLLISGMERGIKGDYQGAITIFSQVITLDAQAVEAYYNRGIAYFRMNQPQKAIADFNTTIELNPNHAEAYWERGKTYLILSQKEKAIQDFETALDLFEEQGNQVAYRWVESQLADLKDRQQ